MHGNQFMEPFKKYSKMNAQAVLTSARYGDDDEIRELLQEFATAEQQDALVNFVQDDSKNTPLHMGASAQANQ